jgi:hypothetical protein
MAERSVRIGQEEDASDARRSSADDLTADQSLRLGYLFENTAAWSILGFRDAITQARRDGTTLPGTDKPVIKPGERFSRATVTSFLNSYGERDERFGQQNRREGFGLKKGEKRPDKPRSIKRESSIWVPAPRVQYQMDIAYYNHYMKFDENGDYDTSLTAAETPKNSYAYALGVIDVNSRYAMVVPLRNRNQGPGSDLREGFLKIMAEMGVPERMNADNEFKHAWWKQWAEENDVAWQLSDPDNAINNKNAIIESFWKVFTKIIVKFQFLHTPWNEMLDKLLQAYNTKKHFTTHERPIDIWKGEVPNRQTIQVAQPRLKVGSYVRYLLKKKNFKKNTEASYSADVYVITGHPTDHTKSWLLQNTRTGEPSKRAYSELELKQVQKPTDTGPLVSRSRKLGTATAALQAMAGEEVTAAPAPPVGTQEKASRKKKKVQQELTQLKVTNAGPKAAAGKVAGKRKRKPTAKAAAAAQEKAEAAAPPATKKTPPPKKKAATTKKKAAAPATKAKKKAPATPKAKTQTKKKAPAATKKAKPKTTTKAAPKTTAKRVTRTAAAAEAAEEPDAKRAKPAQAKKKTKKAAPKKKAK